MDIVNRIHSSGGLTPVELQFAHAILALPDGIDRFTIDELAAETHVSTASISRFCRKIGLSGYRELKTELARHNVMRSQDSQVNSNHPFSPGDTPRTIASGLKSLYELVLQDALECLDFGMLLKVARAIDAAGEVDIYTHSHNLTAAESFQYRMQLIGRNVFIPRSGEQQRICAAGSTAQKIAIVISYSGRATFIPQVLAALHRRRTPIVLIGTEEAGVLHPDIKMHLQVSDREHPQLRISQFASHEALQFVLDVLYGCIFTLNYDANEAYLRDTASLIDDRIF